MALLLGFVTTSAAEKTTEVFTLDHQMSAACEKKIKENLRFEKGVSKIDVSLKENTISITFNPEKTNTAALIEAFRKIGFTAFPYEKAAPAQPGSCGGCGGCGTAPEPATCCGGCDSSVPEGEVQICH